MLAVSGYEQYNKHVSLINLNLNLNLKLQTGFIWPTTSNTFDCCERVVAVKKEQEPHRHKSCLSRVPAPWRYLLPKKASTTSKTPIFQSKTQFWYSNFLFPWMGFYTRLVSFADQFGFKDDISSRKKYQRRFAFALGKQLLC